MNEFDGNGTAQVAPNCENGTDAEGTTPTEVTEEAGTYVVVGPVAAAAAVVDIGAVPCGGVNERVLRTVVLCPLDMRETNTNGEVIVGAIVAPSGSEEPST